jgi:hypothetical protein
MLRKIALGWKVIFQEQRAEEFRVWTEPFVRLRWPTLIDLHSEPFEKAPLGSIYSSDWAAHRIFVRYPLEPTWRSGSPASRSFRRAKSPPVSASMK